MSIVTYRTEPDGRQVALLGDVCVGEILALADNKACWRTMLPARDGHQLRMRVCGSDAAAKAGLEGFIQEFLVSAKLVTRAQHDGALRLAAARGDHADALAEELAAMAGGPS